ncbi:MAG TPA: hypothetical protein VLU92_10895 [Candidatus Dormibacteraeota bacterium]|nr:hypothetical protein [Candidatus Dormibacteraeota bacterium]
MGKGRDKQGREAKKKKKVKLPGGAVGTDVQFRHHSVVTSQPQPQPPPKSPE